MREQNFPIRIVVAAIAAGHWLLSGAALAQDRPSAEPDDGIEGFIAIGPALTTDYEGSSDYEPVPLIIGQIEALGVGFEIEGLDARLNVRPGSRVQFGPAVTYRPGRDGVSNDVVDRLATIDDAVEIGGFLRYQSTDLFDPADEFEFGAQVLADVTGTHDGLTVGVGAGYAIFVGRRWRLGLDTGVTWASDDYAETYFSVDSADAARSGLAIYEAEGGLKDVGAEATLGYAFTEHWGVIGRFEYTRLVGDAADSPVVDREGSADQVFAGLALSYRF